MSKTDNKTTEEIMRKAMEELEQLAPKFNGGKCKESCNCIEIAEWEAGDGTEPSQVKSYPCLGAVNDKIKAIEAYSSNKGEVAELPSNEEIEALIREESEGGVSYKYGILHPDSETEIQLIIGGAKWMRDRTEAPKSEWIEIGKYRIKKYPPIPKTNQVNVIWIENEEGEGTSIDVDKLWEKEF